jgi:hypothetical protein
MKSSSLGVDVHLEVLAVAQVEPNEPGGVDAGKPQNAVRIDEGDLQDLVVEQLNRLQPVVQIEFARRAGVAVAQELQRAVGFRERA